MTGNIPFRKRRSRRSGGPEANEGGTGPAEGSTASDGRHKAPYDPSGSTDDERGHQASLEVAPVAGLPDGAGKTGQGAPAPEAAPTGPSHAFRRGLHKSGESVRAVAGHLADRIIDTAPRVPVRDLATLRRHFPGLGPEEIADRLVSGASKATAAVGAGIGAAAMMPVPPAMVAELAAEITGVAAIEMKLVAELHEVYGRRPPGNLTQRSTAYLTSWTEERGIDVIRPATLNAALGGQMKRELRQQIMKRMVRDLPNLIPFMIGAAVGAAMNRRDTRKLAERIRKDLREQQVAWDRLVALPALEQPADPTGVPPEAEGR
ncbi:hypothetical protein OG233_07085 [Streptomyces sp. NBC_01218]|uniref:hypothetical protein n=1 Tax=unclassified Streptomyces TaxID=2593676 RepID=UPI0023B8F390|nr:MULTISPECIES: hypothetical protein [unclassified Streptomyces]WEH39267.1 hypothetical protein PZB77_06870 [Streptomyces sp. AM 2-1-1]WSQ50963.1 hypothetical protein OG233_07085 [Streptomyces sp. NBC_01218]